MSSTPDRDRILLEFTERMVFTGTWELNLKTNEVFWSDGVYRMLGDEPQSYSVDYNSGLNIVHPDDRERAIAQINDTITKGIDYNIRKRFLLKDGSVKLIASQGTVIKDENGVPVRLIGVFQDISKYEELIDKQRASERRYKALVENGADAIAILDADGYPSYVSPSISNVLGYSESEAMKLNLFELIHPNDRNTVRSTLNQVMESPGVPIGGSTSRTRHKDGSWRWLDATITNLLADPDIRGIVDNFRDVTDWKKMQLMLDTATTMSRVGSWELEMLGQHGDKLFWSPMVREILEVGPDYDISKTKGVEFYPPNSFNKLTVVLDELIRVGTPFDVELNVVTAKGNQRWIRCIGESERDGDTCLRLYGSLQDITSQKTIEEELRMLNERFEKVTQATNDAIWDFDVAQNKLFWGIGFLTQFGYDPDKVKPTFDFLVSRIHDDDRNRVVGRITESMN